MTQNANQSRIDAARQDKLRDATSQQRNAANPAFTRMASANAGSGKTRVLVDRVSRILLQGTEPSDILCLTYTKAAAAEMQERLFEKLGDWSIASETKLSAELQDLFGQPLTDLPVPLNLGLARQLFAKALETPEGLKVQTIHAFCERILSRFPIEAGILPGFEPLEDAQISKIRREVRRQILVDAQDDPDGDIARALSCLTLERADQSLDELFDWMANSGEKIRVWENSGGLEPLSAMLGVALGQSAHDIAAQGWLSADQGLLEQFIDAFSGSKSKTDIAKGDVIRAGLKSDNPASAFAAYSGIFLTAAGDIRAKLGTKNLGADILDSLAQEAQRVIAVCEALLSADILTLTRSVYTVSLRYRDVYKKAKHAERGLDYNDQIIFVRDLLADANVADWVRYKLDGGIEHILVDEAQDTSPHQWAIIDALAAPFFTPSPDDERKHPRTLFAVGDEKQSIFGFQGAMPEMFLDKIRQYLPVSGMGEVRMRMSFRSAQQILDVVDHVLGDGGVMRDMFDVGAFAPASDIVTHPAWRQDKGCVELWPSVAPPESAQESAPWDTRPVDALGESDPRDILAKEIARNIRAWIDNEDMVFKPAKGHPDGGALNPIHAGDILILVRSRGVFFEAVIRQLKKHGIAVAGADRLTLQDSVAVKDILSLTRFVLLPADDLSLAQVLKSPFFGFDDAALFEICVDRRGSVWDALLERAPRVAQILQELITLSQTHMPYDFYAQFLERKTQDGRSFRQALYERLGLEAQDALEAFLSSAMDHHLNAVPSLQRFLINFENHKVEIKREIDGAGQQVRVMTVHGAKGLEAPIVILPDTTRLPPSRGSLVTVDAGFAWKPSKAKMPAALDAFAQAMKDKGMQEHMRLLYVAMTRAESRLIICGYQNKKGIQEGSWYDRIARSFDTLETQAFSTPFDEGDLTGLRYGALPVRPEDITTLSQAISKPADILPAWVTALAPQSHAAPYYVTPSHLLAKSTHEPAAMSPRRTGPHSQFLRGNIIHKLLEVLPEFEVSRRRDIATAILEGYPELTGAKSQEIFAEVFSVLETPEFAPIFAPGSRAEISLAGSAKTLPPDMYLNAQIDRICVTPDKVFIVDYKSNRPSPKHIEDIADVYLGQMAAYRELAREIYPSRAIVCALLWTNGPHLTILPDKVMDASLQSLVGLPKSDL